jgi:1,2-phenylacetyl-CoA epoxidase PaaB subunit
MTALPSVPWIGFLRANRSKQAVVHAADMIVARKAAAVALRTREENVAVWIVAEGEEVEAAKVRVAGSVT